MLARYYPQYEQIQSGTFGVVFKAMTRDTNETHALKFRIKAKTRQIQRVLDQMYLREIDALDAFRGHPYILQMIWYDPLCLATEFCSDMTWESVRGQWNRPRCERAMLQLISAIECVHSYEWMHRDVTPRNVFLMRDGTTKLGDFGTARIKERRMTRIVTARWYRHPKLLTGKSRLTEYAEEIDWWSAACTCAELMTGVVQFKGKTDAHQLELSSVAKWDLPELWMREWMRGILERCPVSPYVVEEEERKPQS